MTSPMHVYGAFAPPSVVVDRALPPPNIVVAPAAPAHDWGLPLVASRVDLPAPLVWAAPDPELLMSITIAPLRLAPVSWGPPAIRRSVWAAPVPKLDSYDAVNAATTSGTARASESAPRSGRARSMAYTLAAVAAAGVGIAAVVLSR